MSYKPVISQRLIPLVSVGVFLLFWELIARSGIFNAYLFPPPSRVALALYEWVVSSDFFRDVGRSLWRGLMGFILGSVLGVLAGLLTGRKKTVDRWLSPVFQIIRPLPPVAIIPLMIIWFGIDDVSKIISIAFAVFFPVWINTHIGASSIPKSYIWSAEILSTSEWRKTVHILLPATLSYIVAGCRNAIALTFIMVYVSELAGASAGIGYQISISHLAYRTDRMMAALVTLALLGAAVDFAFSGLMLRLFPWLKGMTK